MRRCCLCDYFFTMRKMKRDGENERLFEEGFRNDDGGRYGMWYPYGMRFQNG